ncbi:MAG: hypothetical protein JEZ09_08585 [Salinivirgaceae bacterium]|nr:hypothetical protein [Salinivirgaceae bacterium]
MKKAPLTAMKIEVFNNLRNVLEQKISDLQKLIAETKEARDSDSKSSVGDKYETGRAMAQIEIQKSEILLGKTQSLLNDLSKIDLKKPMDWVAFGSLVYTNSGNYFISIGIGKVQVNDFTCYAISLASPLGLQLKGKKVGDSFEFNGKPIVIEKIV